MKYIIIFSDETEKDINEVHGSTEAVARADIVVGGSGLILKDRYGNATSVLADMHRRLTA